MTHRWLALPVMALAFCVGVGCGESAGSPRANPGGAGGAGAAGGAGGTGGEPWVPLCQTNPLCPACPDDAIVCEGEGGCDANFACIESGCASNEGTPIRICALTTAPFCQTDLDCPEGRVCLDLGEEGYRCVKTTAGCDSDLDCVFGFSCEDGGCVDRRVPCVLDADCPVSHTCETVGLSSFCHRVHLDCEFELDCAGIAPRCEDIDGDGRTECAGSPEPNDPSPTACVSSSCGDASAPVCELSQVGSQTVCGRYGLCVDDDDCVDGFECVGLWTDGRKECVPTGGSCAHITDCPVQQVCASSRAGGPPACQAGAVP